jgi:hypothetical protein
LHKSLLKTRIKIYFTTSKNHNKSYVLGWNSFDFKKNRLSGPLE